MNQATHYDLRVMDHFNAKHCFNGRKEAKHELMHNILEVDEFNDLFSSDSFAEYARKAGFSPVTKFEYLGWEMAKMYQENGEWVVFNWTHAMASPAPLHVFLHYMTDWLRRTHIDP